MSRAQISYNGGPSDLLMSIGSVNQSGNFVSAVLPEKVGASMAKQASYWQSAGGTDTMITLWNTGATPEDLIADFNFSGGGGEYQLPLHLNAQASRMLDLKEIISDQQPDAKGNVIPVGTREGSLVISGPGGISDHINVATSAVLYNPQAATCGTHCTTCSGFNSFGIAPNPFALSVGGSIQLTATGHYPNGTTTNETAKASWGSSNTGIATVSSGLVKGVSPGSGLINSDVIADQTGSVCPGEYDANGDPAVCPILVDFQADTSGPVAPVVANIDPPKGPVGTTVPVKITGSGLNVSPSITFSGSGITPTINTISASELDVSFKIDATAPLGAQNVTVRSNNLPSNNDKTFTLTPAITSITPPIGLVGTTVSVNIQGNGFVASSTVQAGSGITTNVSFASSTGITVSFAIDPTAPGGNHAVTVTSNGIASNPVNFYVQIPTALAVLSVNIIPDGAAGGCLDNTFYGIVVNVGYQVVDQNVPTPAPIQSDQMIPQENVNNFGWVNIAPNNVWPIANTDPAGTFHDVLGSCSQAVFSNETETQQVRIAIGTGMYPVRTNSFVVNGPSPDHGSISNGSDIKASR